MAERNAPTFGSLTMRLSDAGLHQRQTRALYRNHQSPPWLTEDATRDRSSRLLGGVQDGPPPWSNEDVASRSLEPIVRR
jgi:hypothetical protein